MKKIKQKWPVLFLILSCFLLRIWHIQSLFYFTYDESIPAFVGRRLILWHHITLIGGVTPFGFHLAPYFYWILSLFLYIGKLNPIAWGFTGAAISILTAAMVYVVGKSLGSKKIGLIATILWIFSFLAIIYDRHFWALYWGPLISLTIIYSILQIIKGNRNYLYLIALVLAFGINTDPSNLVFLVFLALIWIIFKLPITKQLIFSILILILSFLPVFLFDLRHNFANTAPVLATITAGRSPNHLISLVALKNNLLVFPRLFSRSIYVFGDNELAKQYSYCSQYINQKFNAIPGILVILSAIFILTFIIWSFINKKSKSTWNLLSILIITYFVGITIYGTFFGSDIFEHYLSGLIPIFLLMFAKSISFLPKKIWISILIFFIAFNLYKLINVRDSIGFQYKKEAITYSMSQIDDKPFSLDSLSTCWKYSGYRYLFAVFGREPVKSYVDPNFAYLYGTTKVWDNHPKTVISFVIHDFSPETESYYARYALLKSHEIKSNIFGRIEVIIMENSTGWFDKAETQR